MTVDALFDAWERAWSGRDPDAFTPLCTPDVHYEDPLVAAPLHGAPALAQHAQRLWRAIPDAPLHAPGARVTTGRFAELRHVAAHHVDHLFARGWRATGPAEKLDAGRLSDHVPLAVTLER